MRDMITLPKAHLHVHLESAVRWATLHEIASANGVRPPDGLTDDPFASNGLRFNGLRFNGFRQFGDHNALIRGCLRRPEDFYRIAVEFCEDEAAQGVRYVEVTFTAASHGERLGQPEMPLAAVLHGLAHGQAAYGVECRLLLDHSRRHSVDRAWQTLRLATRYASDGVIGIGLAGEESYSLRPFVDVLEAARDAGFHLVHHAGEGCGPASIREAITVGRAERLGHGIRILDDDDLVAEVRERAIPLEVCPSSNVALGLVGSMARHPLAQLRDAGLVVTLNTDIPSIVATSLTQEYLRVREAFGYDDTVMAELARAAIDASFAPEATKARLHRETDAWLVTARLPNIGVP
jgi:adenosine deaminase